jgi:DNA-binding transcriptional regulator YiaG
MTGRNSFDTLRKGMSPAQKKAVARKTEALRADMTLAELRQARQLTQETLSGTLHVGQAAVAKMEKRTDMYVGNLRRFVEAMGGELDVVARFPEGSVKISNFAEIGGTSRFVTRTALVWTDREQ